MRKPAWWVVAAWWLALCVPGWGQAPAQPPAEVSALNPPPMAEQFRLLVENAAGGRVAVSRDQGTSWQPLGQVVRWTEKVNPSGYTASQWAQPGTVAATAVNAIHLKTGNNPENGRGMVFSLLPREFLGPKPDYRSFLSPDSSIYTDLPAGQAIFGGGWAPLVGNPVLVQRGETEQPLGPGYVPAQGDRLVIVVNRPVRYPAQIVFENKFGGLIALGYPDGSSQLIGVVYKPVLGVGRFEGGLYTGVGRIRANHTGVIDVSVSRVGNIGGFQIIPAGHAMSPEMTNARRLTQWMVVGPVRAGDGAWEGVAPLFLQYLRPQYDRADLYAPDWESRLLARFLVEGQLSGGDWGPLPVVELDPDLSKPLPEGALTALEGVERIRILFPLENAGQGAAAGAACGES